jgi:hypothetical protein
MASEEASIFLYQWNGTQEKLWMQLEGERVPLIKADKTNQILKSLWKIPGMMIFAINCATLLMLSDYPVYMESFLDHISASPITIFLLLHHKFLPFNTDVLPSTTR